MEPFIWAIAVGLITGLGILSWMLIQPRVSCPDCGEQLPKITGTKLSGSHICQKCGCEVDRKGIKIKK
jgi:predicted amidophosphoribosyltransferase